MERKEEHTEVRRKKKKKQSLEGRYIRSIEKE